MQVNDIEFVEVIEWIRSEFPRLGYIWIMDEANGDAGAAAVSCNTTVGRVLRTDFNHRFVTPESLFEISIGKGDIIVTPPLIELLDRDEFIAIMLHEIGHALLYATEVEADIFTVVEGYGPALASALEKMIRFADEVIVPKLDHDLTPNEVTQALWHEYEPEYCSSPYNRIQCLRDGTYL